MEFDTPKEPTRSQLVIAGMNELLAKSNRIHNGDYSGYKAELMTPGDNPFPIDVFPHRIGQVIRATNESLQYPVDFLGTAMLYAASVAIGNTHRVEVKKGRIESAILYFVLVGPPGSNKTHPLDYAVKPLRLRDEISHRTYIQEKREYDKFLSQTKKQRNGEGEPIKPVLKKLLLSDFTPESLADVHQYNKRGIGVCNDELATWLKNFNRYNKGSEEQFWLSSWNAQPITIDRKTSEPIYIPLPFIPVIGTIQNGILSEMARDNRSQNGFMDRFLFAMPEGLTRQYWNESELDPMHTEIWEATLSRIMDIPLKMSETANPVPEVLGFSIDAKDILINWINDNADQINDPDCATPGIYSKLENGLCRLALILEMLSFGCKESVKSAISAASVNGAIKLIEYFRNTALRVHELLNDTDPVQCLPEDKQNLFKALPNEFTTDGGWTIAKGLNIAERTYKRLLSNSPDLFKRVKHGHYKKQT